MTVSADNLTKVWKWNGADKAIEEGETIEQTAGGEEETPKMLHALAVNKQTGQTATVNLRGDIFVRSAGAQEIHQGHTYLIMNITSMGNTVFYCSESNIFYTDSSASSLKTTLVTGLTFEQNIDQLAANSHSLYAGSFDKNFSKISGDIASGFSQTATCQLAAKAISIACDDDTLFVLQHNQELVELSAGDLGVKRTHKIEGYTATKIAYSKVTKEIWVGDDDGKVHQLNSADFAQTGETQGHLAGKAVNAIAVSADGTKFATGDTARKIGLWDAASKEKVKTYADQTDKIMSLCFSPASSELLSISQDRSLMSINLDDHKMKKVAMCHDLAKPDKVTVAANGKIYTTGEDCAVRIWNNVWNMSA